jgi:hypothetical protein
MISSIPWLQPLLISSWIEFWFVKVVPKCLNCSTLSKELLSIFILWLCPAFWSRDMTTYSISSAFTSWLFPHNENKRQIHIQLFTVTGYLLRLARNQNNLRWLNKPSALKLHSSMLPYTKDISLRHKEHLRYIKNNNPISAYAMHILHNRHQYGPAHEILQLSDLQTTGHGH